MLQTILEWLERELIYLWYYCDILCRQLLPFYLIGTLLGSLISVFAKVKIQHLFAKTRLSHLGVLSFIPAALLGFASPICMYGTLPLAAALAAVMDAQLTLRGGDADGGILHCPAEAGHGMSFKVGQHQHR